MSKIDDLIKQLQLKKKKIDYINYIDDLLSKDKHCIDFAPVKEEVLALIKPVLVKLSKEIEDGVTSEESKKDNLSTEDLQLLKTLAEKAKARISGPVTNTVHSKPQVPVKREALTNKDKLAFAMENRGLADKLVLVDNGDNTTLEGRVVGLDAPNVIIRTDNGSVIQVPVDRVIVQ